MTEETKRKISESLKGHRNFTKSGWKHTKEAREKIAKFRIGTKLSEEHKAKVRKNHARFWLGKKLSDEIRKNMRLACIKRFGSLRSDNHAIRNQLEYKLWRRAVFQRDNFKCIFCGFKSKGKKPSDIQADHIKPFASFPELRFAIDNGRTLCVPCHRTTDTWGNHKKN
jgi:5-methylcytosine-specific restriction endonuclease McrA